MDDATRILVEGAERRRALATPGKWVVVNQFGKLVVATSDDPYNTCAAVTSHYGLRLADANFIAYAAEDVPALCDKVREQDAAWANERALWQAQFKANMDIVFALADKDDTSKVEAQERMRQATQALNALGVLFAEDDKADWLAKGRL